MRHLVTRTWLLDDAQSAADAMERTAYDAQPRIPHVEALSRPVADDFALPYMPGGTAESLHERLATLTAYATGAKEGSDQDVDLDLRPVLTVLVEELRICTSMAARLPISSQVGQVLADTERG